MTVSQLKTLLITIQEVKSGRVLGKALSEDMLIDLLRKETKIFAEFKARKVLTKKNNGDFQKWLSGFRTKRIYKT